MRQLVVDGKPVEPGAAMPLVLQRVRRLCLGLPYGHLVTTRELARRLEYRMAYVQNRTKGKKSVAINDVRVVIRANLVLWGSPQTIRMVKRGAFKGYFKTQTL